RPLTRGLARTGVTANQVTFAACFISIGIGTLLVSMSHESMLFLLVPAWLFVRMALNAIDGMLAGEFGQKTALGAYLNELADVVSDTALYAPFALVPGSNPWLVGGVIVLSIISEMAGTVAVMTGASRRYDGPMGKSDRALVFSLLGLFLGIGAPVSAWLNWVWVAMVLLIAMTVVNRIQKGLRELGH
ncbi:MAG: CDP-alcohol phosphatidyltransferase family protein, partial [Acidiferrobacterales bacterium]|nr:CDP-alcohol phosphatidyltransferase family protein [Acidiferrobacterales bacterium]